MPYGPRRRGRPRRRELSLALATLFRMLNSTVAFAAGFAIDQGVAGMHKLARGGHAIPRVPTEAELLLPIFATGGRFAFGLPFGPLPGPGAWALRAPGARAGPTAFGPARLATCILGLARALGRRGWNRRGFGAGLKPHVDVQAHRAEFMQCFVKGPIFLIDEPVTFLPDVPFRNHELLEVGSPQGGIGGVGGRVLSKHFAIKQFEVPQVRSLAKGQSVPAHRLQTTNEIRRGPQIALFHARGSIPRKLEQRHGVRARCLVGPRLLKLLLLFLGKAVGPKDPDEVPTLRAHLIHLGPKPVPRKRCLLEKFRRIVLLELPDHFLHGVKLQLRRELVRPIQGGWLGRGRSRGRADLFLHVHVRAVMPKSPHARDLGAPNPAVHFQTKSKGQAACSERFGQEILKLLGVGEREGKKGRRFVSALVEKPLQGGGHTQLGLELDPELMVVSIQWHGVQQKTRDGPARARRKT